MTSKKPKKAKAAAEVPTFASRPAAEGVAISTTIHDQERTLEAAEGPDGWAITPTDEEEARHLAGIADEILNPPPPAEPDEAAEDSVQTPDGPADASGVSEPQSTADNAGASGQEV